MDTQINVNNHVLESFLLMTFRHFNLFCTIYNVFYNIWRTPNYNKEATYLYFHFNVFFKYIFSVTKPYFTLKIVLFIHVKMMSIIDVFTHTINIFLDSLLLRKISKTDKRNRKFWEMTSILLT